METEPEHATMAIFVFREGDALSPPKDIGIIIDGTEVLSDPVELMYSFETFHKIIMDIESRQMTGRVQNLCVMLQE